MLNPEMKDQLSSKDFQTFLVSEVHNIKYSLSFFLKFEDTVQVWNEMQYLYAMISGLIALDF